MAENFPGPYELRLFYTTTPTGLSPMTHVAHYNIALQEPVVKGTAFSGIVAITGIGGVKDLDDVVTEWSTILRTILSNAANNTIDFCELWKYTPGTYDAEFYSVMTVGLAGTSASTPVPAGQNVISFRSAEGGTMKIVILESVVAGSAIDPSPYQNANLDTLADYVALTPKPFLARDTSYPFTRGNHYPSQNEALFRKRYRNN